MDARSTAQKDQPPLWRLSTPWLWTSSLHSIWKTSVRPWSGCKIKLLKKIKPPPECKLQSEIEITIVKLWENWVPPIYPVLCVIWQKVQVAYLFSRERSFNLIAEVVMRWQDRYSMGDIEKVRVLVVGDSGVGKTSLTWLLRSGSVYVMHINVCKTKMMLVSWRTVH